MQTQSRAELESEEDLVQRCRARLSAEEAESCLARLEDRCITWDILRAGVTADDLAEELGFTARECDAVLLDDAAWRGKYALPPAVEDCGVAVDSGSSGEGLLGQTEQREGASMAQNESIISRIVEMGFGREDVAEAMQAAHNDAERAVEYLMTGINKKGQHHLGVGLP